MSLQSNKAADAFETLCVLLSASVYPEFKPRIEAAFATSSFQWAAFVDFATDHLVAPAVAYQMHRLNLYNAVPDLAARYFRAFLRLNQSRNARIRHEAREIAATLNKIDVVPILIKGGAGLLSGLYDDPGQRVVSDIDIVVPPHRAEACIHQLAARGYRIDENSKGLNSHAYCTLANPAACAPIDLHHEAMTYPYEGLLRVHDIFEQAITNGGSDGIFRIPKQTHQIALNIGHAQLQDHGFVHGSVPLRMLYDFVLLTRAEHDLIDWREITDRFARTGHRAALEFHCLLTQDLLGVDSQPDLRPGRMSRLMMWRARILWRLPRLRALSDRFCRVYVVLKRDLSHRDLRLRLLRKMRDPRWWRRNLWSVWRGDRRYRV